ncbi:aspartate--tRNA ligase [Candidatus Woesearchaeota archaeon]|nr:aspartate--tRNA ligase [Candidatus Woesearchaeota archaeon]
MLRTHTCGELNKSHADKKVTLAGWADTIRVHGKVGFIIIRDRYGKTQLFLGKQFIEQITNLKKESVIQVEGKVNLRPENQIRKEMSTGEIEVGVSKLEVLNPAEPLPMELDESITSTDETRLKYRFIDLRRKRMQDNIITRHKVIKAIRDFLDNEEFLEIETPFLAKSTPEGARDYLVPSRINKGKFFALPQSPQLLKQLLMISGFDRYFQIVRCFRDEDLRADRQPEFTQLDMEMTFIEEEDLYGVIEKLMKYVWKEVLSVNIKTPFPRLSYKEAMKKYKTDRPHLDQKGVKHNFVWVVDFPMFEYSKEEKRLVAMHHPFTQPKPEDVKLIEKTPEKVMSRGYDLVLNGEEIAGGSIRNHNQDIQKKIFKALKITDKEADEKFGFLLKALSYGAPPHGGIAFGIDRMVALIVGEGSIRDVIAFPKNKDARDLMLDSPSEVNSKQLDELGIKKK